MKFLLKLVFYSKG